MSYYRLQVTYHGPDKEPELLGMHDFGHNPFGFDRTKLNESLMVAVLAKVILEFMNYARPVKP